MPEGQVLEFARVTKRFGAVAAVSDFSARVEPGVVTGFLGPNGAGKTTSLRMLLGLVRPTSGTATIGGSLYADLKHPMRTVGAALEASSFHPGRTGANHLKVYAQAGGLPVSRVDEVLGLVGLADVGGRKVGGYSLGMRQRLGLAAALLGDPGVVVLDEPANGLDPEGIRWIRTFLRQLAREGRTVLTSSHLLSEVQQTAQALVIISQGRLVFTGGIHELALHDEQAVIVDSPDRAALVQALRDSQVPFEVLRVGLTVRGADAATIGAIASSAGVALSSLQKRGPALEEVFLELVNGLRVHPSASGIAGTLEAATDAETADAVDDGASSPSDEESSPQVTQPSPAVAEPTPAVAEPSPRVAEPVEAPEAPEEPARPLPGATALAAAVAGLSPFSTNDESDDEPDDNESDDEPDDDDADSTDAPDSTPDESDVGQEEAPHSAADAPDDKPSSVFAVAATGVIDVIPGVSASRAEDEQAPDSDNVEDDNEDADPDTRSAQEGEQR